MQSHVGLGPCCGKPPLIDERRRKNKICYQCKVGNQHSVAPNLQVKPQIVKVRHPQISALFFQIYKVNNLNITFQQWRPVTFWSGGAVLLIKEKIY